MSKRFCKRGHDTDVVGRNAHGSCRECVRGHRAVYRAANRDKLRASNVTYRAAHPDKMRARSAAFRATPRGLVATMDANTRRMRASIEIKEQRVLELEARLKELMFT